MRNPTEIPHIEIPYVFGEDNFSHFFTAEGATQAAGRRLEEAGKRRVEKTPRHQAFAMIFRNMKI